MALTPVEDALALVLADLAPVAIERVPLDRVAGRVLAEDLRALRTQPPFDAAAMDGWALRAADAVAPGARLRIVGEAAAGHHHPGIVGPGEAVRIFTGAPMPRGADTVVMQEATRRDGDVVEIAEVVPPARHIRPAGIDFHAGDVGLTAGIRLGYTHVGLIASMNHAEVAVYRRPRVAFLATGDELVRPGAPIGPDQIVCSNSFALAALVEAAGGEPIDLGIAPDDLDATRAAVRAGFEAGVDLMVTLGGASVGDHDHVHDALAAEGVDFDFWKIAMRPGKPLMFGRRGATRVIGLPGNPAASLVCAVLFVAPHVRALSGQSTPLPPVERLPLARAVAANDLRQDYLRARIVVADDGRRAVEPLDSQDSSLLSRFARADALVVRPPFAAAAAVDEIVDVVRLF